MIRCSTAPMPKVLQRQHRRCSSCSKVSISIAYFAWGRTIVYFIYFHIFIYAIWAIICFIYLHIYLSDYWHYFIFICDICLILPVRSCLFIFMLHITLRLFYFTFSFFIAQQCFFPSPISHGGEQLSWVIWWSKMQKSFSTFSIEKENIIFSFYLCEERICRVDFFTRFSGFVFDWNSYSRRTFSCPMMSSH